MKEPIIKDSGNRQEFETGAVRVIQEGKGRYDLLPVKAIKRLSRHFELGAKKYGEGNWKKGIPESRYLDSGLRHIFRHMNGEQDEDHLVAACWNLMCLLDTREAVKEGLLDKKLMDITGK